MNHPLSDGVLPGPDLLFSPSELIYKVLIPTWEGVKNFKLVFFVGVFCDDDVPNGGLLVRVVA